MKKSLDKKIYQINNIVRWWKTKLLLKLVKKKLWSNFQNKHYTKEEKLDLFKNNKHKELKYSQNSNKWSNENREIIDEHINKLDLFYVEHSIDNKYLENAKNFIEWILCLDTSSKSVNNKNFYKVMQLIYGQRFLVLSNDKNWKKSYIHMEIKKFNQEDKDKLSEYDDFDMNRVENKNIIARHFDNEIDMDTVADCLLEWKDNIINKIDDYKNIDLIKSCSWTWDKDFIEWWKENRENLKEEKDENGNIIKKSKGPSKIIDLFEREKEYSYWMRKSSREDWFWRKRMRKDAKNLPLDIEKYEKEKGLLAEGERIIDLKKMREYQNKED